ncbi:MAG: serine hydroxymethyltransferase, partial [Parcubacteria group bacterium]|nr:serine hydroxymethyltransferase [Parcubacteria group bacterium]
MKELEKLKKLWRAEEVRQKETISLIPSENFASKMVRSATGSVLTNKYSEGYPGKRYYPGNVYYDAIEILCQQLALKVFNLSGKKWAVNVQPYSGSPANLAILMALMQPGDTLMGMKLASGGHLTHGHKVSATGIFFKSVQYGVTEKGFIDYADAAQKAELYRPKVIICGSTAYPRKIDFKKFSEIAKNVGAYLLCDISHVAGLVATGNHPNCFPYCDVAMFTTHKNFRGPRGAVIISKLDLIDKINRAVFPTLQGGPHNNQILAKAIAFAQALTPAYKKEQKQVVANAAALSEELIKYGYQLYTGGTDNHLMLLDLSKSELDGSEAEKKLEAVGILANRNSLPQDDKPFKPSGLRIGTPSVTARGMKEKEIKKTAELIDMV